MKIQPSNTTSIRKKNKAGASNASGQFQALFEAQNTDDNPLEPTHVEHDDLNQQPQQPNQASAQQAISSALDTLEQTMLKLDEGQNMPQQALAAIQDLRLALENNPHPLPKQVHSEADTILAVEAKRLETLNKI